MTWHSTDLMELSKWCNDYVFSQFVLFSKKNDGWFYTVELYINLIYGTSFFFNWKKIYQGTVFSIVEYSIEKYSSDLF